MLGVVRVISNLQTNSHLVFFHSLESFFDNIQEVFLLVFFRVRNIEQVLQLASVIPVFTQRNVIVLIIITLKNPPKNQSVFELTVPSQCWLCRGYRICPQSEASKQCC